MRKNVASVGRMWIVIVMLSAMSSRAVVAQRATFAGAVVRDTMSHGIAGAVVSIPTLGRADTTDANGEFKLSGLAPGRYALLIRHIGFRPMVDTVLLVSGANQEREYLLDPVAVELDSVRVAARADRPLLSPHMAQFEEHRRTGFGHFMTDSLLRKNDDRTFGALLTSRIPGVHTYSPFPKTRPTEQYLSSGRCTTACRGMADCPVMLYVDGIARFTGKIGDEIPDLNRMPVREYAAVEYYAGGATLPLQYNMTGNGCGVLVLWYREKLP